MITDWLQTGSLFLLAVLNVGVLAAVLNDYKRLEDLEVRLGRLEMLAMGPPRVLKPLPTEAWDEPPAAVHTDINA
jgi:hypothetical protein